MPSCATLMQSDYCCVCLFELTCLLMFFRTYDDVGILKCKKKYHGTRNILIAIICVLAAMAVAVWSVSLFHL